MEPRILHFHQLLSDIEVTGPWTRVEEQRYWSLVFKQLHIRLFLDI